MTDHWLRTLLCTAIVVVATSAWALTPQCRDTTEHRRLQTAMYRASGGSDAAVLNSAMRSFQKLAGAERDLEDYYNAWMCGVSYYLDRMNILEAYRAALLLKDDLKNGTGGSEEEYMGPMMLGQVYNVCGNVSGAITELAYCHETAERLGGQLRLDRTSETGTSFTLGLPLRVKG